MGKTPTTLNTMVKDESIWQQVAILLLKRTKFAGIQTLVYTVYVQPFIRLQYKKDRSMV
jgi:hypothetical protein